MDDGLLERFMVAFESIAHSLAGINETKQREFAKQWPEPRQFREAVVTRVPNEEDKILEAQGVDGKTLEEWLEIPSDEAEFIGEREREFLEREKRNAGAEGRPEEESTRGSTQEVGSNGK